MLITYTTEKKSSYDIFFLSFSHLKYLFSNLYESDFKCDAFFLAKIYRILYL
jgi:hypothetical protein